MPHLFRREPLIPITAEQALQKQQEIAAAHQTLEDYEAALKVMPRNHELYKERRELVALRGKELVKLINKKNIQESERILQLQNFTNSLKNANDLFQQLKKLNKAIEDPKNDLSEKKFFKNHKLKEAREAAKKFIPTAQTTYESMMDTTFHVLLNSDVHHHSKEKEDLQLLTRTTQNATKVVNAPTKENIRTLLQDKQELKKRMGTPLWVKLLAGLLILTGVALAIAGLYLIPVGGALGPVAGAKIVAKGVALYSVGSAAGLIGSFSLLHYNETKSSNALRSSIQDFMDEADRLLSVEERYTPAIEMTQVETKGRPSAPSMSPFPFSRG